MFPAKTQQSLQKYDSDEGGVWETHRILESEAITEGIQPEHPLKARISCTTYLTVGHSVSA